MPRLIAYPLAPTTPNFPSWTQLCLRRSALTARFAVAVTPGEATRGTSPRAGARTAPAPPRAGPGRRPSSRARPDVEHPLAAAKREPLADERDDVRLRDRLSGAERQRLVLVRERPQLSGNEEVARDALHRGDDALVVDAAPAELPVDPVRRHG